MARRMVAEVLQSSPVQGKQREHREYKKRSQEDGHAILLYFHSASKLIGISMPCDFFGIFAAEAQTAGATFGG
jgi:hypothetical protein